MQGRKPYWHGSYEITKISRRAIVQVEIYPFKISKGGVKRGAKIFTLVRKDVLDNPDLSLNQPFSKWGEVFGGATIAAAIIDRLVHHSIIMNIKGKSYRIKDLVQEDFNDGKK